MALAHIGRAPSPGRTGALHRGSHELSLSCLRISPSSNASCSRPQWRVCHGHASCAKFGGAAALRGAPRPRPHQSGVQGCLFNIGYFRKIIGKHGCIRIHRRNLCAGAMCKHLCPSVVSICGLICKDSLPKSTKSRWLKMTKSVFMESGTATVEHKKVDTCWMNI